MTKRQMIYRMLLALALSILFLQLGCVHNGGSYDNIEKPGPGPVPGAPPVDRRKSMAEIDRLEKHIDDLGEYEKEQRKIGVINQVEHDKSRGVDQRRRQAKLRGPRRSGLCPGRGPPKRKSSDWKDNWPRRKRKNRPFYRNLQDVSYPRRW